MQRAEQSREKTSNVNPKDNMASYTVTFKSGRQACVVAINYFVAFRFATEIADARHESVDMISFIAYTNL
jgi:hypothetical protein